MNKKIVGSEEWLSLPQLNIPAIKARVDSGAKTSALHAYNIQTFYKDEVLWVSFEVNPLQSSKRVSLRCESPVVDKRYVKSSTGEKEKRFVIRETMILGDDSWDIEITLTNRDSMGYRMLLGREAMLDRLIVDPADSFCQGRKEREEIKSLYNFIPHVKNGLNLGLLASNPELYSNKRILEAARERGHTISFFNIKHCYIKLDANTPQVHYRGGRVINDLDAVIPRIKPAITFYGCAVTRQFEAMNVYCLNGSDAVSRSRDKLLASQLLLTSGLDIPITGFANSPLDTDDLIDMVGGAPLIVKLLEGTQGKGVVLTETRKAAESVINAFKSLNANILVQEFIKEADGKDIRCFVIDGKVVAAMQRIAAPGEFRANLHQGGSSAAVKLTPEEKKMAVKAVKVLGLSVAGVDIIRSAKGSLILEVNSSPGLEGIEEVTEKDIASYMITAIEKKLGWKAEK